MVTRLELSTDMTALFPRTAEAEMLARITRVFGGGDVGLVLVRAREGAEVAEVEQAAKEAATALRKCGSIAQVMDEAPAPAQSGPPDPTAAWRWAGPVARAKLAAALTEEGMRKRLRDTRALLLAPGASDVAAVLARDPLRLTMIPFEGRVEIAAGARAKAGGAFVADEGRARLLVVEPRGRVFEWKDNSRFAAETEAALEDVRRAHPKVRLEATGGHIIAKQTEVLMRGDLQKSSVLSGVLASIVFVLTFRRPRALVAVLPPLAAGTLWTTAIATIIYPKLSAIATAFMAVVVGVGVDTGVHVYGRLLGARREGRSPSEAAVIARRETWRPTLGAAVAAGGAFGCLAMSDIAGMQQLGVLCAIGEVLTAIAILVVVPEVGAWLERGTPPAELRLPGIAALTATRPRALLVLGLAVGSLAGALALGAPRLDHGVVALDGSVLPGIAIYDEVYATFGGTRGQLVIASSDPDEGRARARADAVAEVAEQLASSGAIDGFDALGTVAPSLSVQHARIAARDALDLPGRRALLERVLREEGFAPDAFAPALEAFAHPSIEVSDVPADEPSIAWLRRRHLGRDDKGVLAVTFVRLSKDDAMREQARATLRAADPEAVLTGFADLEVSLRDTMSRDLPRVLVAAAGIVVLVLGLSLRKASAVALAGLVLVVEIAIVMIAARVLGVRWHVYDALVLPVLLGITLDEALFLLEASKRGSIEEALAEQAPLATTTALTTAAGFGALVICKFGGLVDVGKVGALGSAAGLLCALVIIPAGFRVWSARRPPASAGRR
ncbi:MAG: MMPL family transporter [Deltaproteobacteria bacterium]|nr:MMPL family transporter [Deltaproteobacteria bacterium]